MNNLEESTIVIVGFAREGLSTLRFLRKQFPAKPVGVTDALPFNQLPQATRELIQHDGNLVLYLGPNYLNCLKDYQVIIKSAGVPLKLLPQLNEDQIITSPTQLFFDNCKGKIIGVTGTKGKSTTTCVIYKVIKASGRKAVLCGNIGVPALDQLNQIDEETVVVCELSSHQLQLVTKSPQIAVLQNIVPEHLDHYKDFDDYVGAKANIAAFQKADDYFLYNAAFPIPTKIAALSNAAVIPFNKQQGNTSCFVRDGSFIYRENGQDEVIMSLSDLKLPGEFNQQNVMPAIIIGKFFQVPTPTIVSALTGFKGLEDRLEFVGTQGGVDYYNDSLSTIPESAIAAIDALGDRVETLIAGGFDRGLDFTGLGRKILGSKIQNVILFPTTGDKIAKAIESAQTTDDQQPTIHHVSSMPEAIQIAKERTHADHICLLSPASPSFGLFKDYHDRGNQFKQAVFA